MKKILVITFLISSVCLSQPIEGDKSFYFSGYFNLYPKDERSGVADLGIGYFYSDNLEATFGVSFEYKDDTLATGIVPGVNLYFPVSDLFYINTGLEFLLKITPDFQYIGRFNSGFIYFISEMTGFTIYNQLEKYQNIETWKDRIKAGIVVFF